MRQVYLGTTLINDIFLGDDRMDDVIAGSNIDNDAQNFFTATGITNKNLQLAINSFVAQLKFDGLWNKMIQILPFVADDTSSLSTQFAYNLKNTGQRQVRF